MKNIRNSLSGSFLLNGNNSHNMSWFCTRSLLSFSSQKFIFIRNYHRYLFRLSKRSIDDRLPVVSKLTFRTIILQEIL